MIKITCRALLKCLISNQKKVRISRVKGTSHIRVTSKHGEIIFSVDDDEIISCPEKFKGELANASG